jgi:hypothetical protein
MRAVDLALYADALAGEAIALQARAERARSRLHQAAIERRALGDLPPATCERLEALGVIAQIDELAVRAELDDVAESLAALRELQVWVESKLAAASDGMPRH